MVSEMNAEEVRLQKQRQRADAWRERQRRGAILVSVAIEPDAVAGLEALGMLPEGNRDPQALAGAVTRFLAGAATLAELGSTWWPAEG